MNDEIEKSIAEELVGEWELKEGKLVKLFQFSSFMNAIDFVNEIAKLLRGLTIIQSLQLIGRPLNFL